MTFLVLTLVTSITGDLTTIFVLGTMFFLGAVLGFLAFINEENQ